MTTSAPPHLDMPLTWDDISLHAKSLALKLADKGPGNGAWTGVIAVTTGGLVPACIVARHLGIRNIQTFCISSYDDQSQRKAQIIRQPVDCGDGTGWLVVDDLSDQGTTLRLIREYLPKAYFATIYAKPAGEDAVNTYIMSVSQDTWLHFPWEENEKSYIAPTKSRFAH